MNESRLLTIEFTLPHYGEKWVPLSGNPKIFGSVQSARKRCEIMGPVYFTCGGSETKWMQRIVDVDTGDIIEYVNDFRGKESETESE